MVVVLFCLRFELRSVLSLILLGLKADSVFAASGLVSGEIFVIFIYLMVVCATCFFGYFMAFLIPFFVVFA